jgi:hypothetical protein
MENLSISILGLSSVPLKKHTSDFVDLTSMTSEGTYMNLTDKSKLEMVSEDST